MTPTVHVLPFEQHLVELENKITELRALSESSFLDLSAEIETLTQKLNASRCETYQCLTPWQVTQIARHPQRPRTLSYLERLFHDFVELHGGRQFPDDNAIVCGLATFHGEPVVVVGHQKGKDTEDNIYRNFGMPHPEGYRKALRVMKLANKFGRPIITFVDTPGAYPGLEAEERGQAEAIARNCLEMSFFQVPVVVVIVGEGGSGGAVALGVGDAVIMLEYAIYSVISPEGCASILWKDASRAEDAATALKLTSQDLLKFGVIDEVVTEPVGGAHRDFETTAQNIEKAIAKYLALLKPMSVEELQQRRQAKYRQMGIYTDQK
ncbi:MAG: acetyl-CoA carboxylase carboxyltransferase subunit alpha [Candidatus Riflebacteria bacterium]|nr:acetyl-CoA carboxylase carboxyltransferase subunit alpha [Candidatus Riflebacteria bacterium]